LLQILSSADVLLESYRPGVMERLGLGPDECQRRAPRLVYGRMTGWGQSGPYAQMAGHDPNYIAITGAMHAMGYADRPPTPPLNIVGDFAGGSLYLVMGILAAILHARATGQGQVVDASILDGTASLMTMVYAMHGAGMWSDQRGQNLMDGSCPFGSAYRTADGNYMAVCALEPSFFAELVQRLGLDQSALPKQWDRTRWPELREHFAEAFASRTRAEWTKEFDGTDACVAPVLSVAEAPHHPQNIARKVFVGDKPIPAAAPRFSKTPTQHAKREPETAAALLQRWGVGERHATPPP
jgi:alpha-methylacyl-CoA racemase